MDNSNKKKLRKYFLYTFPCVCAFALVYTVGWFVSLDANWIANTHAGTPRQRGLWLLLFMLCIVLGWAVRLLIETIEDAKL